LTVTMTNKIILTMT